MRNRLSVCEFFSIFLSSSSFTRPLRANVVIYKWEWLDHCCEMFYMILMLGNCFVRSKVTLRIGGLEEEKEMQRKWGRGSRMVNNAYDFCFIRLESGSFWEMRCNWTILRSQMAPNATLWLSFKSQVVKWIVSKVKRKFRFYDFHFLVGKELKVFFIRRPHSLLIYF